MTKLTSKSACAGVLPATIGTVTASELPEVIVTSVAPYNGQDAACSTALKSAHGMAFPAPNRATGKEGNRAIWFGQRMAVLQGPAPDLALANHAAITDQSDAWAIVRLQGQGAADVLARLTPLDVRPECFKVGHTARSDLKHMAASITRTGKESFQIMVFRAFAQTLAHDLKTAMEGVAARAVV